MRQIKKLIRAALLQFHPQQTILSVKVEGLVVTVETIVGKETHSVVILLIPVSRKAYRQYWHTVPLETIEAAHALQAAFIAIVEKGNQRCYLFDLWDETCYQVDERNRQMLFTPGLIKSFDDTDAEFWTYALRPEVETNLSSATNVKS